MTQGSDSIWSCLNKKNKATLSCVFDCYMAGWLWFVAVVARGHGTCCNSLGGCAVCSACPPELIDDARL